MKPKPEDLLDIQAGSFADDEAAAMSAFGALAEKRPQREQSRCGFFIKMINRGGIMIMKRLLRVKSAALTALMLCAALCIALPVSAQAAAPAKVYIRVADTVARKAEDKAGIAKEYAKPFGDILPLTEVTLKSGDTMQTLVDRELPKAKLKASYTTTAFGSYLSGIGPVKTEVGRVDALSEGNAGPSSGWTFFLNDWSIDNTPDKFTLKSGDVIELMYTCDFGADLRSKWDSADTRLKGLSSDSGVLDKRFASMTTAYTLTAPQGVGSIKLDTEAYNKYYNVAMYIGDKKYARNQALPVKNGTVIKVVCGDGAFGVTTTTYSVKVKLVNMQLSLKQSSINLTKGKSLTLGCMTYPAGSYNKYVTWASNNDKIATVEKNGKIKAVKTGKATVTAMLFNKVKTTVKVNVVSKPVQVKTVEINNALKTIKVKRTHQLSVSVGPANFTDAKLSFSSSAPKVATVDACGKLTALTPGKAKITARLGAKAYSFELKVVK